MTTVPSPSAPRPVLLGRRRTLWVAFWAAVGGLFGWQLSLVSLARAMGEGRHAGLVVSGLFLVPLGLVLGALSGALWARSHAVYERRHRVRRALARLGGRRDVVRARGL